MKFSLIKILTIIFLSQLLQYAVYETKTVRGQSLPVNENLPEGFPEIIVTNKNNPSPGHYFLSTITGPEKYSIIIDTNGTPLYFEKRDARAMDFRLHDNGYIVYHDGDTDIFIMYDSSYNPIDQYAASPGYETDFHDLILLQDGSYWIITAEYILTDMSLIVEGGNPNGTVVEGVVQHISSDGTVLFQWNSLDHIAVTDTDTNFVDLTGFFIDYMHINALDIDTDGNLLISSRHLNEVTKIDVITGNIIWRLGGNKNEFTFINDDLGFSGQHSIQSHGNGYYTLFDNGNFHEEPFSRGVRYLIDENSKTIELKQEFLSGTTPSYSSSMGHFQWNEGQGGLIGWSNNTDGYVLSEYDSNGNKLLDILNMDGGLNSYRATKSNWETNSFYFLEDTINLTWDGEGDPVQFNAALYNNSAESLIITGSYITSSIFTTNETFPISIPANEKIDISLTFAPQLGSQFSEVLTMYSLNNNDTVSIACQTRIIANLATNVEENYVPNILIAPNPTTEDVFVRIEEKDIIKSVIVLNLSGRLVRELDNVNSQEVRLDMGDVRPGLYLVSISTPSRLLTKKLIVK